MNPVSIIAATPADRDDLFAWRNDPLTQRVSKSTGPVEWATHVAWFAAALASPDRGIYIGYYRTNKIGSIRFDRIGNIGNAFLVSIVVAPEQRGRGFGKGLLRAGIDAMPGAVLTAEISQHNLPSRRIFKACEFRHMAKEENGDLLKYCRTPAT